MREHIELPSSTLEVCEKLIALHRLTITSVIVLSSDLKLIGTKNYSKSSVDKLVEQLLPILQSKVKYTNLTIDNENLFLITKDEFDFIFIIA